MAGIILAIFTSGSRLLSSSAFSIFYSSAAWSMIFSRPDFSFFFLFFFMGRSNLSLTLEYWIPSAGFHLRTVLDEILLHSSVYLLWNIFSLLPFESWIWDFLFSVFNAILELYSTYARNSRGTLHIHLHCFGFWSIYREIWDLCYCDDPNFVFL